MDYTSCSSVSDLSHSGPSPVSNYSAQSDLPTHDDDGSESSLVENQSQPKPNESIFYEEPYIAAVSDSCSTLTVETETDELMSITPLSNNSGKDPTAPRSQSLDSQLEDVEVEFNNRPNDEMDITDDIEQLDAFSELMDMELGLEQFFDGAVPVSDAEKEIGENDVEVHDATRGKVLPIDPFSLPEIVSHVLHQINNESDLKACRLFNPLWNAEACKVLRKRSFVNLKSYTIMRKYVETMKNTEDFIHGRFSLQNLYFRPLHEWDKVTINQFLRKFGPKIKHCVLSLNQHCTADDWWTLLYNMSGLEELVVHIGSDFRNPFVWSAKNTVFDTVNSIGFRRMNMMDVEDIPHGFLANNNHIGNHPAGNNVIKEEQRSKDTPNPSPDSLKPISPELHLQLQRISVFFNGKDGDTQAVSSFFRTLLTACSSSLRSISCETPNSSIFLGHLLFDYLKEADRDFINLRELNFWMKLKFCELRTLCRFNKLTHLKLVIGEGIREEIFANAVIVSCPTLETLELVIQSNAVGWKESLPLPARMPRLRNLKVYGYRGSLGFILKTPLLQKLDIHGIGFRFLLEEMSAYKSSSDVLKCLKVKGSDGYVDTGAVCKNLDCFTYLKSLELGNATDEALRMIYLSLPKLQDLKLSNGSFTDMGLTGVPKLYRDDIIEHNFHVTYIISDDYENLRQSLYIGNLLELRTLSIASNDITDVTVMLGLTRLPKLRKLTLSGDKITDHSVETMSLFMVLESLDISGCQRVSEDVVSKLSEFWGISICSPTNNVPAENVDLDDAEQLLNFDHRSLNTNNPPGQQQEQLEAENIFMDFFHLMP